MHHRLQPTTTKSFVQIATKFAEKYTNIDIDEELKSSWRT